MISFCCFSSFSYERGEVIGSDMHDWRIVLSQFTSISFVESYTSVVKDYLSIIEVFLSGAPYPGPQLITEPRSLYELEDDPVNVVIDPTVL